MCGICGHIDPSGVSVEDLERMTAALRHRGPDDEGIFHAGGVGFGHRRLSIIDLHGGRQPMANEDGSVWITFNGEIYNHEEIRKGLEGKHQFSSRSDTEVILHLYEEKGERCLDDLRGMFAFAIHDFRTGRLLLARDHFGQKPLYYWHEGDRFSFASEIKSLLELNPDLAVPDEAALHEYLTLRIITSPRSMFARIRKLPPAHYLVFQDGKISVNRYWELRYSPKMNGDFVSTLEELERQVLSAVRYHLVSDVPVGAFLSGGMDSSLVVAMMTRFAGEAIKTFSGDVPYKNFSELRYAALVSARYGTQSHTMAVTPSLLRTLPDLLFHLDEPSDPFSLCMYHISKLARGEVKVVLGGDGGDELFGGYDRYYGNRYASYYALLPDVVRRRLVGRLLEKVPEGSWYRSVAHRLKWFQRVAGYRGAERYAKSLSYFYFSDGLAERLYTDGFRKKVALFDPEHVIEQYFDSDNAEELIDKMLYADSMVRMPDHPVMILDRMTMAHGLEARSPFLDHKLAEFCARIPSRLKVKGHRLRHIQVELSRKYLPPAVLKRKKQGFAVALPYMLADEFRLLFRRFLRDSSLARDGYLNQWAIDALLEDHLGSRSDHGQRLWLLLNSELWYRMHVDGMKKEEMKQILDTLS
jgi:asparagine synthase (glutamine-hydrolysing)